jgi:hypothetical protein
MKQFWSWTLMSKEAHVPFFSFFFLTALNLAGHTLSHCAKPRPSVEFPHCEPGIKAHGIHTSRPGISIYLCHCFQHSASRDPPVSDADALCCRSQARTSEGGWMMMEGELLREQRLTPTSTFIAKLLHRHQPYGPFLNLILLSFSLTVSRHAPPPSLPFLSPTF